MTTPKSWADALVKRLADTMKSSRTASGLTAAELSKRTAVGKPLSRAVISDLETGRKKTLDITELLTIAAALGVPPASLLFPDVTEIVEVLPGKPMVGIDAFGWFIGAGGPVGLVHEYAFTPDGVQTSNVMRIPLELLKIHQALTHEKWSLAQHESSQQLAVLPDVLRDETGEQAAAIRRRIEALEAERDRLFDEYRRRLDDHG